MAETNTYLSLVREDAVQGATNQYTDLAQDSSDGGGVPGRLSMMGVADRNPDVEVRLQGLAKQYGVPTDTIRLAQPQYEKRATIDSIDYATLARDFPTTSSYIVDQQRAATAYDDTHALTAVEKGVRFLANSGRAIASGLGPTVNEGLWGIAQSAFEGAATLAEPLAGTVLPENPFSRVAAGVAGLRQRQTQLRKDLTPKSEGIAESGWYSGLQSLGAMVPAIAAGIATGNPATSLMIMSGATGGQAYGEARDKGIPFQQALPFAASQAAIEYATEKIPVGRFLNDLQVGATLKRMVTGQIVTEIPGEQVATVLQDLNEWAVLNPEKPFSTYLADRPSAAAQTLIATVVASGGMIATTKGAELAANRLRGKQDQAEAALSDAQVIAGLDEAAAASKLRARDPASFQQFVAQAAEDGPVQDVFIDASQLQALAQSGVDLAALAQASPSIAAQLPEAAATGGMVRIPVDEYAATIAGTEFSQTLLPHLKTDPAGMTQAEAETYMQDQAGALRAEVEQTLAGTEAQDAFVQSRAAVEQRLLGELNDVGRFTPDVNQAYAGLMSNFYATQALRLGITPEEMAARYPIQFAAEGVYTPETLQQRSIATGALAVERRNQTVLAKALENGRGAEPQQLSDIAVGETQSPKSDGAVSSPTLFSVLSQVRRAALVNPEILNAVVGAVPVDMVDRLFGSKGAAEVALHNHPVFQDGAAIDADLTIAEAVDAADPVALLVGEAARLATEQPGVTLGAGLETAKDGAAVLAGEGDSLSQGGSPVNARASYNIDTKTITLYRAADLSSFLHEAGHAYLEFLADIASRPDAPAEIQQDMQAVLDWFGVPDLATWRGMTLEQKRDDHEKFARGFESYLFEGKAPNTELQGLFNRFRSWMINVYRSLTNLNVTLSDEVRGVFDRLVASSDAIAETQAARGMAQLFDSAEAAGMTADEWAAYQNLGREAQEEATDDLQRRSLRDMKWLSRARSRIVKDLQKEADSKRAAVRSEVETEVYSTPLYGSMQFLRRGITSAAGETADLDGTPHKLAIPALEEMYGGEGDRFALLDWSALGYGRYGMLGKEGLHPDVVAQMFGYTSGDQLVHALLNAEPVDSVIDGMTDQRMLERYGDLADQGAIEAAGDAAVHNEARAKFVAAELNALNKATGQRKVLVSAARAFAEATVARLRVRNLKPSQYATSEAKAARAAQEALREGDLQEAAVQKRNQLINNYAARAAYAARTEVDKDLNYLNKFNSEGVRKNIDPGYLDQIDSLLERFDLRKGMTLREIDKRKSLLEWVKSQEEQGLEPVIDPELINEANRKSYKDMTIEELRGLNDAVRNIEHLGRLKKKLLTAADERDFQEAASAVADSITDNATRVVPERRISERGPLVAAKDLFRSFVAAHRKFASVVRQFDGWADAGSAWEFLVRNMNAAGSKEASMNEAATVKLHALTKPILGRRMSEKVFFPDIGKSFTREERIGMALNVGNEVNRERVLSGENLSPGQLDRILATLSQEDWAFVQATWDYLETYRPQIAAKERRLTGIEPQWVEPTPVVTRFGEIKGGYYPIKYDPLRSSKAEADTNAEVARQMERGLYTRAQTRRGHLKARSESTGRPLRYDLNVLFEHVQQVTHDLAWHEYLVDANRLLRASSIDAAIRTHYGPETLATLRNTLTDIAVGNMGALGPLDKVMNHLRTGSTVVGLGWRVTTSLMQPLGLTQTAVRIGPKWMIKGIAHWAGDSLSLENSLKNITEKSEFMRLRAKTMQREINEIRNRVNNGQGSYTTPHGIVTKIAGMEAGEKVQASYFYLIAKAQLLADVPTWWGMYEKAMAAPDMNEAKAIALADQAVIDSQGSGGIQDLAQIQRGGQGQKLFTSFYSFFNVTYNLTREVIGRTDFKSPRDVSMLVCDLALLYMIPSMASTLIKAALRGGGDDDELFRQMLADQLNYLFGTMVLLRETGAAVQAATGTGGSDYAGPASVRFFAEVAKLAKQVNQGEADEAFWKALNSTAGIVFHYPAGQINSTIAGANALADGKTENPGALLMGAPPKR